MRPPRSGSSLLPGRQAEIDELLEYVGRMRAIGIQSRKAAKGLQPMGSGRVPWPDVSEAEV